MASIHLKDVVKHYGAGKTAVKVIHGVNAEIADHEFIVIVGPSGCGKSTLLRMVAGLEEITAGEISIGGRVVNDLEPAERDIAMVFQDPMTSLNPVFTCGYQIEEALLLHRNLSKREAREQAVEMLRLVKIPDPHKRAGEYPHQLSGGMKQRAMIAMAVALKPSLLIADEPTTALDVTIQKPTPCPSPQPFLTTLACLL